MYVIVVVVSFIAEWTRKTKRKVMQKRRNDKIRRMKKKMHTRKTNNNSERIRIVKNQFRNLFDADQPHSVLNAVPTINTCIYATVCLCVCHVPVPLWWRSIHDLLSFFRLHGFYARDVPILHGGIHEMRYTYYIDGYSCIRTQICNQIDCQVNWS